jgi:DNA polymerase III epsilon subunit-like protein
MNRYVALDMETTGFSPKNLKILPAIKVFAFEANNDYNRFKL